MSPEVMLRMDGLADEVPVAPVDSVRDALIEALAGLKSIAVLGHTNGENKAVTIAQNTIDHIERSLFGDKPKTKWDTWCHANRLEDGTIRGRPGWRVFGVWELIRADGVRSGHKVESPFSSWQETMERSVELYDRVLPVNRRDAWPSALLDEVIRDGDVNFGVVLEWAEDHKCPRCDGTGREHHSNSPPDGERCDVCVGTGCIDGAP